MQIKTAQRQLSRMKMALQGPSGSGKTYSALLMAYGLCNQWDKIAVVDTENHAAHMYAHLGNYQVVDMAAPFTPEKYMQALEVCEKAGMEVVILDSITHEWENLLDYHASLQGNSFTNWSKITPRHNAFVQRLLQSPLHIIATMRTKQDYVLSERNGKMVPEKVGLKSVQRDGMDYEFTLVFDLDMKNHATASKDRTGMFFGKPEQKLSAATGAQIRDWCNPPLAEPQQEAVAQRIQECKSLNELFDLYKQHPAFKEILLPEFEAKKKQLLNHPHKYSSNGTH